MVCAATKRPNNTNNSTIYAIKTVRQEYDDNNVPKAHHEVHMLKLLASVGVGKGLETLCLPAMDNFWYPASPVPETQSLVLEHAPLGTLRDYVFGQSQKYPKSDWNPFPEPTWEPMHEFLLRHIYKQLIEGLAFLHYGYGTTAFHQKRRRPTGRRPVIHRDLKPGNILVWPAPAGEHPSLVRVKISDFGGAIELGCPPNEKLVFMTMGYRAPELIEPGTPEDSADMASDVYAMGATMHCCIYGYPPPICVDDQIYGRVTKLNRGKIAKTAYDDGLRYTRDFQNRVYDALSFASKRKDALAILKLLDANHDRMHGQWQWQLRLAAEETGQEEEQSAAAAAARAANSHLSSSGKLRRRLAALDQCYRGDCCAFPMNIKPHTHVCHSAHTAAAAACGEPWGHAHVLTELERTPLDPRSHMPYFDNYPASDSQLAAILKKIRRELAPAFIDALL